jgi:hypothetical protein
VGNHCYSSFALVVAGELVEVVDSEFVVVVVAVVVVDSAASPR